MSKEIRISLSDDDFEKLKSYKEDKGLNWEGVLKQGILFFTEPPGGWKFRYEGKAGWEQEAEEG